MHFLCILFSFFFNVMRLHICVKASVLSRQTLVGKKKTKEKSKVAKGSKNTFLPLHAFFLFSHYMLFKISSGAIDLSLFLLCHKSTS